MAERPWYETYFGKRYLDAYPRVHDRDQALAEVDMIESTFALPRGSAVLDLCCGHGRHLVELVLDAVARTLKPGGQLLIELLNRDFIARRFQARDWVHTDQGITTLAERRFDVVEGRNHARQVTIYPDGSRIEATHIVRVYTPTELVTMLHSAGLTVESTFGGLDGSELSLESPRAALHARKA